MQQWQLVVADGDLALAQSKTGNSDTAKAVFINVEDDASRKALVQKADIVISLLPPALHWLVAKDCLKYPKTCLPLLMPMNV